MATYFGYIIVGAVALILIYIAFQRDKSSSLSEQAPNFDMEYQEKVHPQTFLDDHLNYQLYELGEKRSVSHVMEKQEGDTRIQVFDYHYEEKKRYLMDGGKGEATGHFRQAVCRIVDPKMDLPDFLMRPEDLLENIWSFLDRTDIDFSQYPRFSKLYHLSGPEEAHIRRFFNDQLLYFLEDHPGWYLEGLAGEFILV
ncbi:MAG TPA: hypothetical protein DCE41_35080, partial [Cytophagales bacterium]|nr:hypothetical protein [Cytophagales bacterium]HAP58429.1 hypothetical protein [Cytophagales bacterium]